MSPGFICRPPPLNLVRQNVRRAQTCPSRTCGVFQRRTKIYAELNAADTNAASAPRHLENTLQRYFETFSWRGYSINYRVDGPDDACPVLLVHGFGASVNHWRKNIPALSDTGALKVYTIDLLGFGASDKPSPSKVCYGLPLWKELICDFMNAQESDQKWSLVGNSIGSLISLMAANELGESRIRSCALMNCAGGLVSFRYSELNWLQAILLRLFNIILFNRFTGPLLFENFRKKETLENVLKQVYIDAQAVSHELLEIIRQPAFDEGACDVFLAILNGDAGPAPEELLPSLTWCPMLVLWGEKDPWTPFQQGLHPGIQFPNYHPGIDLHVIPNAGHCIHDECPEVVNDYLVPFLTVHGEQVSEPPASNAVKSYENSE